MEHLSQTLDPAAIHAVFIKQLNTLYHAKASLKVCLPQLVEQASFKSLKNALQEDLDETVQQMISLKVLFDLTNESWINDSCLGLNVVISEAHNQVFYDQHQHFESDMSTLFYMSVIENIQVGACQILNLITLKLATSPTLNLLGNAWIL